MSVKIPPPLPTHRQAVVRVVAPSGSLVGHESRILRGIRFLKNAGFRVEAPSDLSSRCHRGYLSGSDDLRLNELRTALTDDAVDIVWWARGGSGAARLLPRLLPSLSGVEPKWMIGFSDATSVLNAISIQYQWVTVHGPTVSLLSEELAPRKNILKYMNKISTLSNNPLSSKTPIFGGNLTVLASILGTLDLDNLPSHHLLLEDVNEHPYRLDRALTQLRQSWPLSKLKSIWLGNLDLCEADTRQVTQYLSEDFGCPIHLDAPAGHSGPLDLIPLGLPGVDRTPDAWLKELNQ